jgi:hypothetical protein
VQAHDQDLGREGSVDRAPEQRVGEHAVGRVLKAELEDAVVGHGQGEREHQPARPPVECRNPVGPSPGQLAKDPRGSEQLREGEDDRGGREPCLQVQGVAEEELEVALVRIEALAGEEADGQRDERERGEGRNQPHRSACRRARLSDDVSGGNVCGE